MWTDHEDTGAEETEAGLLVGHKLSAGWPCTPAQRQRYIGNYYSAFQGGVLCWILQLFFWNLEKN